MTNSQTTTIDGTLDSDIADKKSNAIPDDIIKLLKFTKNLETLTQTINNHLKVIKDLKNDMKKLEVSYYQDINKVYKSKRKRGSNSKPIGFIVGKALPAELAKLINVANGTVMSMPEYTKKFYKELVARNLLYENDGRVFRADAEIKKILDIDESVNKSINPKDKNGFNFSTLQGYLSRAMKKYQVDNSDNVVVDID